ncbi:MAG: ABC transporter permease, partial [Hydrococcus sp. Prado102]|nr:ABC transporter permease [Hydrococcus sp. Prado102]
SLLNQENSTMIHTFVDRLGQLNPQLFRELKGRLKPRTLGIAAAISFLAQGLIYLYYQNRLPLPASQYTQLNLELSNRYCIGAPPKNWGGYSNSYPNQYIPQNFCIKDLTGNWTINWQLWWLDLFIWLGIFGILALLIAGTHMLITDLSKEERRGTLNFIRLSPQSATSILTGKMLGVPMLLYLVVGLAIPLHLVAGLSAGISLILILAFYGIVALSCALFYSAALLFGLVSVGLGGFQAWLGSGIVLIFLWGMLGITMSSPVAEYITPVNWLILFYPGGVLPYLVHATGLSPETVEYLNLETLNQWYKREGLASLQWYGQPIWRNAWGGMGFYILHSGLWIYWIRQGLVRRFHNPLDTMWSKGQSYLISASFIVFLAGFIPRISDTNNLFYNFGRLQVVVLVFVSMLIAILSPHRQTLQDWARYRHQTSLHRKNLLKDLVWGEKSPATVAIAINLAIILTFSLFYAYISPLGTHKMAAIWGLLLQGGIILVYAAIAQLMLLMKTPKRAIAAASVIAGIAIVPLFYFAITNIAPDKLTWVFLFSALPGVATEYATITMVGWSMLGQFIAIALLNIQMTRQLQQAGKSFTSYQLPVTSNQ